MTIGPRAGLVVSAGVSVRQDPAAFSSSDHATMVAVPKKDTVSTQNVEAAHGKVFITAEWNHWANGSICTTDISPQRSGRAVSKSGVASPPRSKRSRVAAAKQAESRRRRGERRGWFGTKKAGVAAPPRRTTCQSGVRTTWTICGPRRLRLAITCPTVAAAASTRPPAHRPACGPGRFPPRCSGVLVADEADFPDAEFEHALWGGTDFPGVDARYGAFPSATTWYRRPRGNRIRWSWRCYVLREDGNQHSSAARTVFISPSSVAAGTSRAVPGRRETPLGGPRTGTSRAPASSTATARSSPRRRTAARRSTSSSTTRTSTRRSGVGADLRDGSGRVGGDLSRDARRDASGPRRRRRRRRRGALTCGAAAAARI